MDSLKFQEEKLRLIQWLSGLQDEKLLARISEFIKAAQLSGPPEKKLSEAYSSAIENSLERSMKQIEEGDYLEREDIEEFFRKWQSELSG